MIRTCHPLRLFRTAAFLLALLLAGGPLRAATPVEDKALEAIRGFFDRLHEWDHVQVDAADFIKKFPNSENYDEVVLLWAQALFKQEKFNDGLALLAGRQPKAVKSPDQFVYWQAEAYFHLGKYQEASAAFVRLVHDYPASTLRLDGLFGQAESAARIKDWAAVVGVLHPNDGAFQQIAKTNLTDDLVVRGLLLLGEAQLKREEYSSATQTLNGLASRKLPPESEWRRQYLLCRIKLAEGHADVARQMTTNLLTVAEGRLDLQAETRAFQGEILERAGQLPEAVKAYEQNLDVTAPGPQQRRSLLKIVELLIRQNKADAASQRIDDFLAKHPNEKGSDLELLTLGELRLKQYYEKTPLAPSTGVPVDPLTQARADFEKLLRTYPNSEFAGKAQLNLGWCLLAETNIPEARINFLGAIQRLPVSEDRALARSKVADIQYDLKDYPGAITNYLEVVELYRGVDGYADLAERALCQIVRADIELGNAAAANIAMNQLLDLFPNGPLGARVMLLVGQALTADGQTGVARKIFTDLATRFRDSPLVPEVELAVARSFEREGDWRAALDHYNGWIALHGNDPGLPRAEFSLAWAGYQAGETNAFMLFTNFIVRFGTNTDLAPRAEYWVGDYYWRHGDFLNADLAFQEVFKKWPGSDLIYQAQMMAGLAAMGRDDALSAQFYFTNYLTGNSNCPVDLRARAQFAYGDTWTKLPSPGGSLSNWQEAARIFNQIATTYTNKSIAPLAWGRLANCYAVLATNDVTQYQLATNAYQKAIDSPLAGISTRGMAECGLAQVLEKMARLTPPSAPTMLDEALRHYENVVLGTNRRDGEKPDPLWIREAGLAAARLHEDLGQMLVQRGDFRGAREQWDREIRLYQELRRLLPPLQDFLDKRLAKVQENPPPRKN